jgi:two-component system, cell cycle sensor histidine kinase and response regulator CckA
MDINGKITPAALETPTFEAPPAREACLHLGVDFCDRSQPAQRTMGRPADQELYRALAEASPDMILVLNRDDVVEYANSQAAVRLRSNTDAMLGRPRAHFFAPATNERQLSNLREVFRTGQPLHLEANTLLPEGPVWLDTWFMPIRNGAGPVTQVLGIWRDITARKQMEADLRESRQRFARIFQSNPEAIAITSVETGRVLDVNDSFLVALGFKREEVIGRTVVELGLYVDARDREVTRERLQAEGRLRNQAARLQGKNGRVLDVLMSSELIQLGAEPCYLSIINDITRLKQQQAEMEGRLRRAQKLESVGTLAGGIAHDFNNILTIIQGHTCLLLSDTQLVEESLDSLKQIAQAAERAANLTRQLLTFSRQRPLQRRVLDLNEVVGNMTKMLCRLIGEDITLEIKCSPRLPRMVGDVGMMEQILMNLAINARDAIRERRKAAEPGRLTIGTEAVMAQAPADAHRLDRPLREHVCLTVRDNGCGIPQEIQNRIYDPFFTTKEVGKGTGLGLATVHGIVQEHQGWIDLDSRPGQGTVFRLYLPATQSEARGEATRTGPPQVQGGHETILLVEDEEALRNLAREILVRYGYTVLVAGSGREAMRVWEEHQSGLDLLLTDLVMPEGINGRQLAEMLVARKPDLKVIYTTGYSSDLTGVDFPPWEEAPRLMKPYPPHELAQIVRNCLDGVTAQAAPIDSVGSAR